MLYRHVQPLFISTEYSVQRVLGPTMRVRPLDAEAPDHLMRFVLWGAITERPVHGTRAAEVKDPKAPSDPKEPDVVVVTTPIEPPVQPARPKLLIEMSPDGEGWVVQAELTPRERPYLVTVAQMLQFVRVRLDTDGVEARGYALVMANTPFQLDGRSPFIGARPTKGSMDAEQTSEEARR